MRSARDYSYFAEVSHWRIRATGKANECEPVFFGEMECCFCVALGRSEIEQPVVAIRDLPALADMFDLLVTTFPYSALPGRVVLQAHQQRPLERSGEVL
jgi:hypothetical protein